MKGTKWTDNNGRPDKSMIVYEWRSAHPEGRKVDCIRETGLDKKTVYNGGYILRKRWEWKNVVVLNYSKVMYAIG